MSRGVFRDDATVFRPKKNAAGKSLDPPAATNQRTSPNDVHAPPYEDHQDWAMESPAASLMQLRRKGPDN